jgi:prepilin-type processing-associated H-X9-DG protein
VADRVAWGDVAPTAYLGVPHVAELTQALRPLRARPQLIHGDLTGNVLFADGLPPLILDLSPYWRPPVTAAAIVVADALIHEGADRRLIDAVGELPEFGQYLLRALIFRAVAQAELGLEGFGDLASPVRLALDLADGG